MLSVTFVRETAFLNLYYQTESVHTDAEKMSVVIETTLGDITVDLFVKERPRTCLNFLKLCKIKYYNFSLVHTVQRNFLFQMGDPLGTGKGGESIFSVLYGEQAKYFESEKIPKMKHQKLGTLSMANNGDSMHGSQFFITTGEELGYLDGMHTVFGEVVEGFETLTKVNDSICNEQHRPYKDIRITHTVVLDDPYDDPAGLVVPGASPEPTEEQLKSDYIGVEEDINDNQGKSLAEVEEEIQEKEAKARATILEMVGDLPDADVKPPDNILFVCKLNPVTTDEDLEIIFSRFGKIVSCEVVRDRKTGESLQYAFIEFDKEEDCENAYFKMDNVLIDDRRIHVDFSQSVSKLNYPRKGDGASKGSGAEKGQRSNLVIKDKGRSQGRYDMVFDNDDMPAIREKLAQKKREKHGSSGDELDGAVSKKPKKSHHSRELNVESSGTSKKERRSRSHDRDRRREHPSSSKVDVRSRHSDPRDRNKDWRRDEGRRSPVSQNKRRSRSPSKERNRKPIAVERRRSRLRSPERRGDKESKYGGRDKRGDRRGDGDRHHSSSQKRDEGHKRQKTDLAERTRRRR